MGLKMKRFTTTQFVDLVNDCLEYLTPEQLAEDLKVEAEAILLWADSEKLPEDRYLQYYGKLLNEHPLWDEFF